MNVGKLKEVGQLALASFEGGLCEANVKEWVEVEMRAWPHRFLLALHLIQKTSTQKGEWQEGEVSHHSTHVGKHILQRKGMNKGKARSKCSCIS